MTSKRSKRQCYASDGPDLEHIQTRFETKVDLSNGAHAWRSLRCYECDWGPHCTQDGLWPQLTPADFNSASKRYWEGGTSVSAKLTCSREVLANESASPRCLIKLAALSNRATKLEQKSRMFASHYGPDCITSSAQHESHQSHAWIRRQRHVHSRQVRHAEKRTTSKSHTKCFLASALPPTREGEGYNKLNYPEGDMVTKRGMPDVQQDSPALHAAGQLQCSSRL
jgi:hypothetical protein